MTLVEYLLSIICGLRQLDPPPPPETVLRLSVSLSQSLAPVRFDVPYRRLYKKLKKIIDFTEQAAFQTFGTILQKAGLNFENVFIGVDYISRRIFLYAYDEDRDKIAFVEDRFHLLRAGIKMEPPVEVLLNILPDTVEERKFITLIKFEDLLVYLLYQRGVREFFDDEEVESLIDDRDDFNLEFLEFGENAIGEVVGGVTVVQVVATRAEDPVSQARAAHNGVYFREEGSKSHVSFDPYPPGMVDDGEGGEEGSLSDDPAQFNYRQHLRRMEAEEPLEPDGADAAAGEVDQNARIVDKAWLFERGGVLRMSRKSRRCEPEGEEDGDGGCDNPVSLAIGDCGVGDLLDGHKLHLPGEVIDPDNDGRYS